MVRANFNFTIYLMATYKNRLTEKYFSVAWEAESARKNFFLQKIDKQEFGWYFPPPRIFWAGMKHLKNEKAKGVGVFLCWFLIPTAIKFLCKNHLLDCVVCFHNFETKSISYSDAIFKFCNSTTAIIFEFDMSRDKPLQVSWNRNFYMMGGCQFCL